jgi:hypothetical protein
MLRFRNLWLIFFWPVQDFVDRIADTGELIFYGRRKMRPAAFIGFSLLAFFFWGSVIIGGLVLRLLSKDMFSVSGLLIYIVGIGIGYAIHVQKSPHVVPLMILRSIALGAYLGSCIAILIVTLIDK